MLDKKTLKVVIKALVDRGADLRAKFKEHDGQNRLAMHKVTYRSGYFTHGQLADMYGMTVHENTVITNEIRVFEQDSQDREPVVVEHTTTELPKVRALVEERWPWIYKDIKDFPIEDFVIEILMRKKTGGARTTTKARES